MAWIPTPDQKKYLELVISMSSDCMSGRGVDSLITYIKNIEMIIDSLSDFVELEKRVKAAEDFMDSLR